MDFLLDTSVLIEVENNNKKVIDEITNLIADYDSNFFISFFTFCEFYSGSINKSDKNKEKTVQMLDDYGLLNTSKKIALLSCEIKNKLKKSGRTIPEFDIFIGAMAIENRLPIITLDRHFKLISDLNAIVIDN